MAATNKPNIKPAENAVINQTNNGSCADRNSKIDNETTDAFSMANNVASPAIAIPVKMSRTCFT
jgi:hypothetical protein